MSVDLTDDGGSREAWRKILWKKQDYDDNYVDASFLDTLRTSSTLKVHGDYLYLCRHTTGITQHLSCVVIFCCVWWNLFKENYDWRELLPINVVFLIASHLIEVTLSGKSHTAIFARIRSDCFVFCCLLILSPPLQTLTQTYSNDTVEALTIVLLFLHSILHDYQFMYRVDDPHQVHPRSSTDHSLADTVALNMSMFSAVLLASRLENHGDVFSFLFFSILVFAFSPSLSRSIYAASPTIHSFAVSPVVFAATTIMLASLSKFLTILYLAILIFISLVAPFCLICAQAFKNEIRGPWDIPFVRQADSFS